MRRFALLLALVLPASAGAFDDQPMNELTVASSQRSIAATAGSGCFIGPNGGGCGDAAYPLQLEGPPLMVRRAHTIGFELDHPAESLEVRLRGGGAPPKDGGSVGETFSRAFAVQPEGPLPARRWLATVPEDLADGFARVGATAVYPKAGDPSGDRDFEFGIHVIRRGATRVKVPKLVGRSYGLATRELERRGLRWRVGRKGTISFETGPWGCPAIIPDPCDDRVIAQWLRPGRKVARGSVVTLEVRRARE